MIRAVDSEPAAVGGVFHLETAIPILLRNDLREKSLRIVRRNDAVAPPEDPPPGAPAQIKTKQQPRVEEIVERGNGEANRARCKTPDKVGPWRSQIKFLADAQIEKRGQDRRHQREEEAPRDAEHSDPLGRREQRT